MPANAMTPMPSDVPFRPGMNGGPQEYPDDVLGMTAARTDLKARKETYSSDRTRTGCLSLPLKSGGFLSFEWNRLGGQGATDGAYKDTWSPAGAGGVFSFLPLANEFSIPASGVRVYSEAGTLAYDSAGAPQAELPVSSKRDATYFTEYYEQEGTYFEYFAGTGIASALFGRLNRRYDTKGNELRYHYSTNGAGSYLLRRITGDLAGNVVPYFYYADETLPAPLTKVHLLNLDNGPSRTAYFEYATYSSNRYLSKAINPQGCVRQYDPVVPFAGAENAYQVKREIDPEGYQTYFEYSGTLLTKTVEPEARLAYYNYQSSIASGKRFLGRGAAYFEYAKSAGTGQMTMVRRISDALRNVTYYGYDATLARPLKKRNALGNTTYFRYVGGSALNKYATTLQVRNPDRAITYYGYEANKYDVVKRVGPRQTSTYAVATYYRYDGLRNRTARVDALGNETLWGPDSLGRVTKELDAQGYTTYFNYGATRGTLDSMSDAEGNVAYFGYNAFAEETQTVGPRWKETGSFQSFATYYEYDSLGRQTKAVDALGNVTYFDWTSRGDLLATVDARGTETEFAYNGLRLQTQRTVTERSGQVLTTEFQGYDTYGNVSKTKDGRGNGTYFFWDDLDRLTARKDALSQTAYYFYDVVGNRTHETDERRNTTYYFFDLLSHPKAIRDAVASKTYFFYDLADNRTHVLDARLNATYFFYDKLDRQETTRNAVGNATYFFYDKVGNQTEVRNARGHTTYFFYDPLRRRKATRDALGNYTYFAYDAAGNQTSMRDARGNVFTFAYDPLNRQTQSSAVPTEIRGYDAVGNLTALLRGGGLGTAGYGLQPYGTSPYGGGGGGAAGVATYFFYDGLGRRTAMKDGLQNLTYYFYDENGNQTALKNALVHTTYFGYDALDRQVRMQDALQKTAYYEYDPVGNRTKTIDPNAHEVQTRYDNVNRPDATRFADAGSAYFFYDQVGNRTRDLDPRGNTTYHGYDKVNRRVRTQDALARSVYFEYDPVGNVSKTIGAERESAAFTYDRVDRRTNILYTTAGAAVSDGLRSDPYYIYDAVGNMTEMGDLWGLHRMGYDSENRMTRHLYPIAQTVYYEFDARSNVTGLVYPGAAGRAVAEYDSLDRQTKIQSPSGATAYFTYDALSQLKNRFLGNKALLQATYDAAQRVERWRWTDKNGAQVAYFDYTRDAKGLPTKVVREATHTIYYTYDESDRLNMELWALTGSNTEVYGFRYAYDKAGNRTRARINGADTYYFYDKANQLTVRGTNALFASPSYYEYTKNGSLATLIEPSGTTRFAYNAAGLIARILWRDATSTYFYYDGNLRRYAFRENGTVNYFVWGSPKVIQELNANGTVKAEHTHASEEACGYDESYRPGEASVDQKIYPVSDLSGSIVKFLKDDGLMTFAEQEYDYFGRLVTPPPYFAWPSRFGFLGKNYMEIRSADGNQRLLLANTQLYDPTDGRSFTSLSRTRITDLNSYETDQTATTKHRECESVFASRVVAKTWIELDWGTSPALLTGHFDFEPQNDAKTSALNSYRLRNEVGLCIFCKDGNLVGFRFAYDGDVHGTPIFTGPIGPAGWLTPYPPPPQVASHGPGSILHKISTNTASNCAEIKHEVKAASSLYNNSYIWSKIRLKVCCSGMKRVDVEGSIFPSQWVWQDGKLVAKGGQTNPTSVMWQMGTDTVPGRVVVQYTKPATGKCEILPAPGQPEWWTPEE